MLDADFLRRKVKLIQEDLLNLEKLSGYSFDEIAADPVKLAALERFLEVIVMRALDINQHIIAEAGDGTERVRGYEDTFYALAKLGVYDEAFAKEIAPSAGLRNRLVHEYNHTDEKIIYESVADALRVYVHYCDSVLKFLEKHK